MLAILLISIIANGFIILRFSPSQFYKLHRYDGQLLYIKATFSGILATAFAFLLDTYFGVTNFIYKALSQSQNGLAAVFETEHLRGYIVFFFLAVLVSVLYCYLERIKLFIKAWWLFKGIANRPPYGELAKILLMHTILNDSPLDKLFFLSYIQNIFLLITMSDRKVYVGRVINLGEPNEKQGPDQEISIVPVFSGYRDKDTLSVKLNHSYANNDDAQDFYLVLKQDNIVSACEFVYSLYKDFSKEDLEAT
jgi:hypothetical protein